MTETIGELLLNAMKQVQADAANLYAGQTNIELWYECTEKVLQNQSEPAE